jgi:L-ascorbate metabolism protein UlaG (beta-lactamase superfamily)
MLRFAVFSLVLAVAAPSLAQEPKEKKKEVILRWFGQSFFQLQDSTGQRIAIDPHAIPTFGNPRVKADFVLITHLHDDHNQPEVLEGFDEGKRDKDIYRGVVAVGKGTKQDWKRYNETRGPIKFRTLATFHDAQMGIQRGKNAVWIIEVDGLVFCHLGDLGHELSPDQVKAIGKVDVLMVPVGGIYTINGETAKKVVEQIKPRLYVLPMHYGVPGYDDILGPEEFLEGQKNVKKMPDTNELVIPADMKPPETPIVVMLGWKKADPPEPPKKP